MKTRETSLVGTVNPKADKKTCNSKDFVFSGYSKPPLTVTDFQESEDREDEFICPACCCGIYIELPEETEK